MIPRISVVIPAYNEERHIAACLEALTRQTISEPFEVIVVDNASTDRTAEIARSYGDRLNLRIIYESTKGRGAARAAGFAAAGGDILFSTDADTQVPPSWLQSFCRDLRDDRFVAVTGTGIVKDSGWWRNFFVSYGHPLSLRICRLVNGHYILVGFNFAIRRDTYLASGGFDPLFDGQEDVELSKRVATIGKALFRTRTPVTTSGRRFRKGLFHGLFEYLYAYWQQMKRGNTRHRLPDAR